VDEDGHPNFKLHNCIYFYFRVNCAIFLRPALEFARGFLSNMFAELTEEAKSSLASPTCRKVGVSGSVASSLNTEQRLKRALSSKSAVTNYQSQGRNATT
jgi:hypothetical protein